MRLRLQWLLQHSDLFTAVAPNVTQRLELLPEPWYFVLCNSSTQILISTYQGIGSGGGIRQLIAGSGFAGSDTGHDRGGGS